MSWVCLTIWFYFFGNYLSQRYQYVKIKYDYSEVFLSISGVLQGSNLGPLLFVIYMNNIKQVFKNSFFLLYADDLKIYKLITSANSDSDSLDLQSDLDRLEDWCNKNHMYVNMNKSSVISFSKRGTFIYCYNIGQNEFVRVTKLRDLGVLLCNDLRFNEHIFETISKALKSLGFVMRSASLFHTEIVLKVLYFSLVLPILEYASIIWAPFYAIFRVRIERVQNRFFRFMLKQLRIPFDGYSHDYSNIRVLLQIPLVTSRFLFNGKIFLYKILNVKIDCSALLSTIRLSIPTRGTRNYTLYQESHHRTNYGCYSLFNRLSREANELPNCIDFFDDNLIRFTILLRKNILKSL